MTATTTPATGEPVRTCAQEVLESRNDVEVGFDLASRAALQAARASALRTHHREGASA